MRFLLLKGTLHLVITSFNTLILGCLNLECHKLSDDWEHGVAVMEKIAADELELDRPG